MESPRVEQGWTCVKATLLDLKQRNTAPKHQHRNTSVIQDRNSNVAMNIKLPSRLGVQVSYREPIWSKRDITK